VIADYEWFGKATVNVSSLRVAIYDLQLAVDSRLLERIIGTGLLEVAAPIGS